MKRPQWTLLPLLLVGGLALPAVGDAQPMRLDTPPDSPLWWTLTDEISPAQLRQAFLDAEANKERYREAVAAGLEQQPVAEEELENLKFSLHGRLHPELVPMWLQFWLSSRPEFGGGDPPISFRELAEYGVSRDGAALIIEVARASLAEIQELSDSIAPLQREFIRMQWEVLDSSGSEETKEAVEKAVKNNEYEYFATATGRSAERVAELFAAGMRNAPGEVVAKSLVRLRNELSAQDWGGLRRFLLAQAVFLQFTDF